MNVMDLKIGARLEIELLNKHGEKRGPSYVSQLLHVVDDQNIIIASPICGTVEVYVSIGISIRVFCLHDSHGLLSFTGTVKNSGKKGNISMLLLSINSKIKKIQRRKYYRLPCYIDISYCVVKSKDTALDKTLENKEFKKAITKNLSASGICIVVEEKIPKGTYIYVIITVHQTVIKALCKVIRSSPMENSRHQKHELGMHFVNLSQTHQDLVVKYIFDQQRELLKKDLLDRGN